MDDWEYIERQIRLSGSEQAQKESREEHTNENHRTNQSTSSNEPTSKLQQPQHRQQQTTKKRRVRYREKNEEQPDTVRKPPPSKKHLPNKRKRESVEPPPLSPVRIVKAKQEAKPRRRDFYIEERYPPPLRGEHIVHITTANHAEQTAEQIRRMLNHFSWILVESFNDSIPFALQIVENVVAQLPEELHRINIPSTFLAEQHWEPKHTDGKPFFQTVELPKLHIELSLKPLISRHMGYQHYRRFDDYNRQRKRYRPRNE